ncbi:POSSIBLE TRANSMEMBRANE PROTEIN [[Actinomadura] parvosata subsp. kistnae]|uniref:DUF4389 domain-containing protein n=1 Tax=[Actinomadura] parvosata subsp. kistnae TaxID=1909395 RepID=A0A1U9ZZ65_9ACTN|nr:DUF4389 domain-containing protein [Nonomuraea sp. ATCC 55076]AQZ63227.1 hypothetical protein BKM31_18750 [Nonomuraea sp. ATCC 55076]SPL98904.1 POSSIBLE TRANSMEMBRANE PROTEIN [Actinomadura parvosata subsp. kistnae]
MSAYPVRVEARLEEPLNRGLWIVKWLLAIPHYIVLSLLWVAFAILTVIAFFAILFTGRYPRALFDFNVGVLRWTWRVAYYTYGALATDRYPPFTLGPAPDYPATLEIDYPERLSRGLVLVKWWLLAIPHYLVVGLFSSGSAISWRGDSPDAIGGMFYTLDWGGLIGLLVLVAALALLFTGRYPHGLYDFVMGMNRWSLRVAAYASLMTDAYPPFRLEQGGHELPRMDKPAHVPVRHGAASVVTIVLGSLLAFAGLASAATAAGVTLLDRTRDSGGFVGTSAEHVGTSTYALTTEQVTIAGQNVRFLRQSVGRVRIETTGRPLFIGIARESDVGAYLRGVAHERIARLAYPSGDVTYDRYPGAAPASPPGEQTFWAATGSGSLTWDIQPGDWAAVIMNADGTAGVTTDVTVAATLPWLGGLATGLVIATIVLLAAGVGLVLVGIRLAVTPDPEPAQPTPAR